MTRVKKKLPQFSEKMQITDSSQSFLNNLTLHASHFVQDAFNIWDAKSRLLSASYTSGACERRS